MQLDDIPEVSRVERQCFTNPWPQSAYRRELRNPGNSAYIVLWYRPEGADDQSGRGESRGPLGLLPFIRKSDRATADQVAGFAGMWALYDEAHVTTIGVAAEHRGKGLGELLLVTLIEEAERRNTEWVTLEVRVSNDSAQALYRKYGFTQQGVRRRYYSDNGEDAYIMWSPSLRSDEYRVRLQDLRAKLGQRLAGDVIANPNQDTRVEPGSRTMP
jgi:ribosomal-protein-alanine N-acetyltransferase